MSNEEKIDYVCKAEVEILAKGAIFSPKHGRMLEIEVPNV